MDHFPQANFYYGSKDQEMTSFNKTAGDDIGVQMSKKEKKEKDKKSSPTPKKSSNKLYVVPREYKAVAKQKGRDVLTALACFVNLARLSHLLLLLSV